MTTRIATLRGSTPRTFWIAFIISTLMLTMIAGVALAAAPTLGIMQRPAPATAMPLSRASVNIAKPLSWAAVAIAKPTYTPSPSPVPTFTPTTAPTPTVLIPPTNIPTQASDPSNVISMSTVEAGSAPSSDVTSGGKYILVSISEQHLYAYDNGQLIYSFVASTGMGNSTRIGNFTVLDKIPNAYGSTWDIWMPNWMGIYYAGTLEDGIHALPILPSGARLWSGYLGTPISFGCVVLGVNEAQELYDWADVGTPVVIRY